MDMWSRRKAAVEAEAQAEVKAQEAALKAEAEAAVAEKSDEEILAELDLPEPETLGEGDDFKPFLSDAVPARLKTRALRQLWKVNPVLANVDGLVDYGEDFTDAAMCIEGMQSAYQVGKGMLAHVQEMARQAAEAAEAEAAGEEEVPADDEHELIAVRPPAEEDLIAASAPEEDARETDVAMPVFDEVAEDAPTAPAPGSRRMIFTFDDQRTG